jgi:hypothetical protein
MARKRLIFKETGLPAPSSGDWALEAKLLARDEANDIVSSN